MVMNTAWTFLAIMVVYPFSDPGTAIKFLQLAINYRTGPAVGGCGLSFQGSHLSREGSGAGPLCVSPVKRALATKALLQQMGRSFALEDFCSHSVEDKNLQSLADRIKV